MSEIRTLRTFLAVEKYGSLAAAADRMALTQAAVGQQMRTLEEECRRPLFDRSRRMIRLNEAGRALVVHASRVVAAYDSLILGADTTDNLAGSITVGATGSAMGFLSNNVIALKARYPELNVRLVFGDSADLLRRVRSGEIDGALAVEMVRADTTSERWTPLYDEPLVLLASALIRSADEDSLALLQAQPFIRFERRSLTGANVERVLRRMHVKTNDVLEVNSIAAIIELVRQNVGVSIVPQLRHVQWSKDTLLDVLPLPVPGWRRVIGILEGHRQPHITSVLRGQLVQALIQA
ncbi:MULTISPECIES: LysR family transcriptional regulator [Paraburkholderia]|uniref:LysR family transcriptional regulator n=1 Tax=Paraburkholderia TaxID=1822464 RepID=UPI00225429B0|nr:MULTISPECIES: LysR family transcriptional regulator [Paraburkholderia]MCX4163056.1 LysR family transcriptional regulator [Paraburkholderia megapolitana]MDN7158552.1 LysR family transcriptional regulator [Paraburkholderia sp. CHISQ3]MDQ6495599.1 LysR family transcriptional regulator [Paraburkholderia megapolitana]